MLAAGCCSLFIFCVRRSLRGSFAVKEEVSACTQMHTKEHLWMKTTGQDRSVLEHKIDACPYLCVKMLIYDCSVVCKQRPHSHPQLARDSRSTLGMYSSQLRIYGKNDKAAQISK